jgi:hypothetical protein
MSKATAAAGAGTGAAVPFRPRAPASRGRTVSDSPSGLDGIPFTVQARVLSGCVMESPTFFFSFLYFKIKKIQKYMLVWKNCRNRGLLSPDGEANGCVTP